MRLLLAFALMMIAAPAMAFGPNRQYPCWVRVHQGAQAYLPGYGDKMQSVPTLGPTREVDKDGSPILYVDTLTDGRPWIWRLREYAYHRHDVDLFGDCSHVRVV